MGLLGFLASLFGGDKGRPLEELASRLDVAPEELRGFRPEYREFTIPKRSGGSRRICAPKPATKRLQRRVLRRLLARLSSHPAAHGFERGRSIVTNALPHVARAVVVRMDLRDFFTSTSVRRVRDYFKRIGWGREAADVLTRLTTLDGGLPQGAPTSPRISNLVNRRLDARLSALAGRFGAAYTRYADNLTFSFARDNRAATAAVVGAAREIVSDEGYALHGRRKFSCRRRCSRQEVTGLVVNEGVNLPRETRRMLRAALHRAALHRAGTGREPTLSPGQLAGWRAFVSMVARQSGAV